MALVYGMIPVMLFIVAMTVLPLFSIAMRHDPSLDDATPAGLLESVDVPEPTSIDSARSQRDARTTTPPSAA